MAERPPSTLIKALGIVEEIVRRQSSGLTFAQVVARTGVPKTSTHRILKELSQAGYLVHDRETGRYRGSLKLSALGAEVLARFDLRLHMRPHLIELHRKTRHTCNLAIRAGEVGVYIDRIESPDYGLKLFSEVGQTFPLHSSGLGKALLAFAEPKKLDQILAKPLTAYTPMTIVDPKKLRAELEEVRHRGYAMEREETFRGIMCLAAPVLGPGGSCVGAVSLPYPVYAEEELDLEKEVEALLGCTGQGSAALGFQKDHRSWEK